MRPPGKATGSGAFGWPPVDPERTIGSEPIDHGETLGNLLVGTRAARSQPLIKEPDTSSNHQCRAADGMHK
jgi:hypothetical protein